MMNRFQRGQALPLGLALALVGMLAALVLYDTGRAATDKARLANAADAAAYSGLLWQARALNYQAYTNRAMIANQVSIAQAVSLRSWTAYGEKTSRNIATVLSVVPPMKVYAEGVATVMETLNTFVGPVADAMVGVVDGINRAVAASQDAMYKSSFAATREIVTTIARESDARFRADTAFAVAGLAGNLDDWRTFTHEYDASDIEPMRARVDLINASRDDFSRKRQWRLFEDFWFYSTPLTRHKIFRDGETRLVATENGGRLDFEWKAVDTLSLQNRIFRFAQSEKKQEAPIGWGAASAASGGGTSGSSCDRGRFGLTGPCPTVTANSAAERRGLRQLVSIDGYRGLNAFRSLGEETLKDARQTGRPVLRLRTEVALDASEVRSSGAIIDGGRFGMDLVAPGDRLSSISAAEVFYRRPDDAPGAATLSLEGATGHNPYWDVRLAPVSTEERLLAIGLRGGGGGTVAPGGSDGIGDASGERIGAMVEGESALAGLAAEGVQGTLPDYVGALADVMIDADAAVDGAVDLTALDDAISETRTLGEQGVEALAEAGDHANRIKRGFEDNLDGAVNRILSGIARRGAQSVEAAAGGVVESIGGVVESAQGMYDTAVAGANDVLDDAEAARDRVTGAFDEAVEEARASGDAVRERLGEAGEVLGDAGDAFGEAGDALGNAAREAGERALGDLDVAAYQRHVAEQVGEARAIAKHMDEVRIEVARRMHEQAEAIHAMTREEMSRRDFEDPPYGLTPRQFKGYDVALLTRIAGLMATTMYEVDPETPIHGVMVIEASKFFYTEHVNLLRYGTSLAPPEPLEEEAPDGEGSEDADEDAGEGEGGGESEEPETLEPEPWVEDEVTTWGTFLDEDDLADDEDD